jgi:hypothetical protein
MHLMDQDNEIVAEDFAHGFVLHGGIRPTTKTIPKLAFYHAKGRFHIAAFVVVRRLPPLR